VTASEERAATDPSDGDDPDGEREDDERGNGEAASVTRLDERPDADQPAFGDAWVYESIVSALPRANLSGRAAIALQVAVFEVTLLVVAAAYGLQDAVVPGTVAVGVAAVGSYVMLDLAEANRSLDAPPQYYRLLFGSSIEVVLGVLAFAALVTHLFVFEPTRLGEALPLEGLLPVAVSRASEPLVTAFLGSEPPVVAAYLMLLVLWDLCYRIGTSWWTAVVSLYRELRVPYPSAAAAEFRRLDVRNVGFAATQVALLPFLLDRPILLVAVGGHVLAVTGVSGAALLLSRRRAA
jgi:hypothetical protein